MLVQILQNRYHREPADKFRNEAELNQVGGLDLLEQVDIALPADRHRLHVALVLFGQEAHGLLADAPADDFFEAHKRAAADEQDVGGVNGREFLVRMLTSALWRHVSHGAFENLEQGLLDALARYVARDGRVLVLAANFVDFVDVDNTLLAFLHVAVSRLQQFEDDVLDVFSDVAGFGQRSGVDDGEG